MLDSVFFIVLVLNSTGLFSFLAPQFGVNISQISIALLIINAIYLLARLKYLLLMVRRTETIYWLLLLFVWPIVTILYAPEVITREAGLQLFYASLFVGAAVFTLAKGYRATHRVITISLFVSIGGILLSMLVPAYFEDVALLAQARTIYLGRGFGFFMEPNRAATSLSLQFLVWYSLWRGKNSPFASLALLFFLFAILMTGSRTGAVIWAILSASVMAFWWKKGLKGRILMGYLSIKKKVLLNCGIMALTLVPAVAGLSVWASSRESVHSDADLFHRVSWITGLRLTERGIGEDVSAQVRLGAQLVYLSDIRVSPLFGHGLGAEAHYHETGRYLRSSHSALVSHALQYGLLYPFVLTVLIMRMYGNRRRIDMENELGMNTFFQFLVVTMVLYVVYGDLFSARVFYVVLGMLFSAIQYPNRILQHTSGLSDDIP